MLAVAVFAILLAIFMFNARMRVEWKHPRIDDVVVAGALTLAESVVLYYLLLATIVARGLINPARRIGRVRRVFIYGPALGIIAIVVLFEVLDVLVRSRW